MKAQSIAIRVGLVWIALGLSAGCSSWTGVSGKLSAQRASGTRMRSVAEQPLVKPSARQQPVTGGQDGLPVSGAGSGDPRTAHGGDPRTAHGGDPRTAHGPGAAREQPVTRGQNGLPVSGAGSGDPRTAHSGDPGTARTDGWMGDPSRRYARQPMPATDATGDTAGTSGGSPDATRGLAQYPAGPVNGLDSSPAAGSAFPLPPPPPPPYDPALPPPQGFSPGPSDLVGPQPFTGRYADLLINVREAQTGRLMFGVGVNSDLGLTGQIVLDERNFDWRRFPTGLDDILNGTAWRGGGQGLRIEAIPGTEFQRYLVNFTEPYLMDTLISLNLSGYLYDRRYFDWDEERLGGRIGLGYRLTPDLSLTGSLRLENVDVFRPRIVGVPELDQALGDNELYSGKVTLAHDTRDSPFAPTEGHYVEFSFEQAFGDFDFPRGVVDYRRYYLLTERPDGSGRHVLGASLQAGFSGTDTPIFEHFFAGGYTSLRGFRFRGASPRSGGVIVGGDFSLLGSVEYLFPVTADDMLKGVIFCDYGTVEEEIAIHGEDFRVALGAGLRVFVPAMGPAPIALDFAVPVAHEDGDEIRNFSFFVGFAR